jgi:hypothetical protein
VISFNLLLFYPRFGFSASKLCSQGRWTWTFRPNYIVEFPSFVSFSPQYLQNQPSGIKFSGLFTQNSRTQDCRPVSSIDSSFQLSMFAGLLLRIRLFLVQNSSRKHIFYSIKYFQEKLFVYEHFQKYSIWRLKIYFFNIDFNTACLIPIWLYFFVVHFCGIWAFSSSGVLSPDLNLHCQKLYVFSCVLEACSVSQCLLYFLPTSFSYIKFILF